MKSTTQSLEKKATILKELTLVVRTSRLAGSFLHQVSSNDEGMSDFFKEKTEEMKKQNENYIEKYNLRFATQKITTGLY